MSRILPRVRLSVRERLLKNLRACRDPRLKTRYLIICNLLAGRRKPEEIAEVLGVHRDTVYRVAKRFREDGEFGLLDRRAYNGPGKLQGKFLDTLDRLVRGSPQDHGHHRPTWTRELLVLTLVKLGFPKVHPATLSRALKHIKARRGRPRPTVGCPWPKGRKTRRLNYIRQLIAGLRQDEAAAAALLPATQPNRAGLGGSPCRNDAQPHVPGHGQPHDRCSPPSSSALLSRPRPQCGGKATCSGVVRSRTVI